MVHVAVIGLGPVWDSRYLPALQKLRNRITVRALYDPVAARSEQAAAEVGAEAVHSLIRLTRREDLDALLLLDTGWIGLEVLHILKAGRKPVYISGSLGEDTEHLHRLHADLQASSLTFMPEFSLRHTPATARLQELLATKLGRPKMIQIEAIVPCPGDADLIPGQGPGTDFLVGLLDWCSYVVRTAPERLESKPLNWNERGECIDQMVRIEFKSSRGGGEPPVVELRIRHRTPEEMAAAEVAQGHRVKHDVICERGHAHVRAPSEISWQNGAELVNESLTSERSEVEVMLDHFCRRVVGGLIPVADVADVCRSIRLARAVEESLKSRQAVPLNGKP